MQDARLETVAEKSAVEGRNEYLERENVRLKSELHEEVKKKEYAERESARNAPLTARVGNSKSIELAEAKEKAAELARKLVKSEEDVTQHVRTGVQAVHDARDKGFEDGVEHAKEDMRGTVSKMQEEVREVMAEMVEMNAAREKSDQLLKEHDDAFHVELKRLHIQLEDSGNEIASWKRLVGEKEAELLEERRQRKILEDSLKRASSKMEYEVRAREEVVHQANDEVEILRRR